MYVYKSVCNCVILEGLNCKRYTNIWEGTERDREEGLQKFPQTTRLYRNSRLEYSKAVAKSDILLAGREVRGRRAPINIF